MPKIRNNSSSLLMHKTSGRATKGAAESSATFFDREIEEKWLSTFEAAHWLGISPNALRILVCRGRVKYFKLGCRLRFRKQDLTALLSSKGESA